MLESIVFCFSVSSVTNMSRAYPTFNSLTAGIGSSPERILKMDRNKLMDSVIINSNECEQMSNIIQRVCIII